MPENSPASQRRERETRRASPEGTVEITAWACRVQPSLRDGANRRSNPALKRRAIGNCPLRDLQFQLHFGGRVLAPGWIALESAQNNCLDLRGYFGIAFAWRLRISDQSRIQSRQRIFVVVGDNTRNHFVKYCAHGINVRSNIAAVSLNLLR